MLPDYPRVKTNIEKRIRTLMRKRAEAQCLPFSKIKPMILHEGKNSLIIRADGSTDNTPMKLSQATVEIKDEEAIEGPPEDMVQKFLTASDNIANQMTQHFLGRVSEAAHSVGNVVKSEGGQIIPDTILELLDKLLIDFDDCGNPQWPTLVSTSLSNHKAIEAAQRQLEEDPMYRARFEQLIHRKREEYRVRESNRRLVD